MTYKILHLDNCEMTQVGFEQIATNYCCVDFIIAGDKDFKECSQLLKSYKPDLTVINLDNIDHLLASQLIEHVGENYEKTNIVLVANSMSEKNYEAYYEKGVRGFLYLNSDQQSIIDCILSMYKHDAYVSEEFKQSFQNNSLFDRDRVIKSLKSLTFKELKVSELIILGKTTSEIADILCNSKRTIDAHRRNISEKLRLIGNKSSLATFLIENQNIFHELFNFKKAI